MGVQSYLLFLILGINLAVLFILATAMFATGLTVYATILTFSTMSIFLLVLVALVKYYKEINIECATLAKIFGTVFGSFHHPVSIFRFETQSGKTNSKILYSNDNINENFPLSENLPSKEKKKLLSAVKHEAPVKINLVEIDTSGHFIESQFDITPVKVNAKVVFWLGNKIKSKILPDQIENQLT